MNTGAYLLLRVSPDGNKLGIEMEFDATSDENALATVRRQLIEAGSGKYALVHILRTFKTVPTTKIASEE